jgi:hypothetical protein
MLLGAPSTSAGKPKYSNIDLNTSSLKMYWNVVNRAGGQDLYRHLLLALRKVADKHGCSVANVALRWGWTGMALGQGIGCGVGSVKSICCAEDGCGAHAVRALGTYRWRGGALETWPLAALEGRCIEP